jgi:hypothetical protein
MTVYQKERGVRWLLFIEGIEKNNENPHSALPILGQDWNQGPSEYET